MFEFLGKRGHRRDGAKCVDTDVGNESAPTVNEKVSNDETQE